LTSLFSLSRRRDATAERPSAAPREGVLRCLPIPEGDAALVGALCTGHAGAPALLVDRYGQYVERLLMRVVGPDAELPDLLQEVFARALAAIHELKEPPALKGWLGSIALFTARAWVRDRNSRSRWVRVGSPAEISAAPATTLEPEVNEALARTYAILNDLPADERIVFALRFIDGMELKEIAEVTQSSVSTIKRRLARAERRFLRKAENDAALRERLARSDRWRDR